jgi:hypothetical protein
MSVDICTETISEKNNFENYIMPILKSNLDELKLIKDKKSNLNFKDLTTCNYINTIKCTNKCVTREDNDKPMCHYHIRCIPVHQ